MSQLPERGLTMKDKSLIATPKNRSQNRSTATQERFWERFACKMQVVLKPASEVSLSMILKPFPPFQERFRTVPFPPFLLPYEL